MLPNAVYNVKIRAKRGQKQSKQADKLVGEAIFSPKLVDNFNREQADKLAGEAIFSPFHFFTFSPLNRPFHL